MYSFLNLRNRILQVFIFSLICLSLYVYHYTSDEILLPTMLTSQHHSLDSHLVRSLLNTSSSEVRETLLENGTTLEAQKLYLAQNTSTVSASSSTELPSTTEMSRPPGEVPVVKEPLRSQKLIEGIKKPRGRNSIAAVYRSGHSVTIPEKCPDFGAGLKLLIVIMSAPNHAKARKAIRLTWGHFDERKDVSIAFILGSTSDSELEKALLDEQDMYGDMIRGNFVDGYSNLTLKAISVLEWVCDYCWEAKFVLKTDDDMFINVPRLLEFVDSHSEEKNVIFGRLAIGWKPNRNKASKYYVSWKEYKLRAFPQFTTGPAYLLSGDVVPKLYKKSLEQTFVKLEDVFITGIVAQMLSVQRKQHDEFTNQKISFQPCKIQRSISIHKVKYHEQFDLWKKSLDGLSKCPP